MTRRFLLSREASDELDESASYLAENAGLETALRFHENAEATFRDLLQHPGMGRPRSFRSERLVGARSRPITGFENWLVFYVPIEGGIRVLHVLHGAREIESILGDES